MPATARKLAEAVKDELNAAPAGTFSEPVTAARRYVAKLELDQLDVLDVTVLAQSVAIRPASRGADAEDWEISIGVRKRLADETPVEVDPLVDLVEEIGDYLRRRELSGMTSAHWSGLENTPLFVPEHLDRLNQFTSLLTVSYRVFR